MSIFACRMCGHADRETFFNPDTREKFRCTQCGIVECVTCLKRQNKLRSSTTRIIAGVLTFGVGPLIAGPPNANCPECNGNMIKI